MMMAEVFRYACYRVIVLTKVGKTFVGVFSAEKAIAESAECAEKNSPGHRRSPSATLISSSDRP